MFSAFLLLTLFWSDGSQALTSSDSDDITNRLTAIVSSPTNEIDLVETLLLISRHWDETVNLDSMRQELKKLTASVKEALGQTPQPKAVVETLRKVIHNDYGYRYTDSVDQAGIPNDPAELFIHGLLKNKRGYCMNLSLLYLMLAEKLNLPLYGIALPNHFFVRYESSAYKTNIETTQEGIPLPDRYYYERFAVSENPPDKFFMKNLDRKKSLGSYFSNVGMAFYKHSQPDKAVFYLKLSAQINNLSIEAHNNLGNIYSELKQTDKAIQQYLKAIEADPENMASLFNLGIAYMESGNSLQATEAFRKALKINPAYAPAHQILAKHFMKQKDYSQALPHLKKLSALEPNNIAFQEGLAEAHYRLDNFDQAIEIYRSVLRQRPGMIKASVQLGWTFYRKGMFYKAIEWTLRGLKSHDRNQKYRKLAEMNLGLYYALTKEYSNAEKWYETAMTPADPRALASMVNDLKEASVKFPNRYDMGYFIGWLYFKAGENDRAEIALQKFISLQPQDALAIKARDILIKIRGRSAPFQLKSINAPLPDENMIEIPEGFFIMGSNNHGEDEKPEHKVYLDAYYIDKYEVTARQYAQFLNETKNTRGININNKFATVTATEGVYHARNGLENYPVNLVNWHGAKAFCLWKDKRLPTEAEWEKAARGMNGQIYPWGIQPPNQQLARYNQSWTQEIGHKVMVPVDSMPEGKSPYGNYHMVGNVKEWVDDWFDREYYMENHKINPKGQIGGELKTLRGGSWRDLTIFIYSSFRNNSNPATAMDDYGFRCAKSGPGGDVPKQLTQMELQITGRTIKPVSIKLLELDKK